MKDTLADELISAETMRFVNDVAEETWNSLVTSCTDLYALSIFSYAERWARCMQCLLAKHENLVVADIADETSHKVNLDITGFQFNLAVKYLSQTWIHGEALRQWHNAKYGYKGDGIVNSAILVSA